MPEVAACGRQALTAYAADPWAIIRPAAIFRFAMSSLFPLAFKALARLPLPLLHNLGALAGWLAWLLSPTYRRNLATHIGQAGMTSAKSAAIAEAGKAVLELPKIWLRPQDEVVARVVKVSGWELVEAAWAAGRGILFLTPHLGCFEITAQYYAASENP
jgi:KDO2-lipid IV(A) lauroyltransferase